MTQMRIGMFCLLVMSASARADGGAEVIERLMAVVGGHVITLSDVSAAIQLGLVTTAGASDPLGAALNELIDRRLELAEVDRYGPPEPAADQIQKRLDSVRARLGDPAALTRILTTCGLTEDHLRAELRDDLRLDSYINLRFVSAGRATEEELVRYYEEHREVFTRASGELPPFEEVRGAVAAARERDRRKELIANWINDLRRRGEIVTLYKPPSGR